MKQLYRKSVSVKKENKEFVHRRGEGKSWSQPRVSRPEATVARKSSSSGSILVKERKTALTGLAWNIY